MPKDIFLPFANKILIEKKNIESEVLIFPEVFEQISNVNLPITIKSGQELILTGPTLRKKPYDIYLKYNYFFDTSKTPVERLVNYQFGKMSRTGETQDKIFIKDFVKNVTLHCFENSQEDKFAGNRSSGDIVPAGEPLIGLYKNAAGVNHLFHNYSNGSDIVFEDFYVDESNTVKFKYKNRGSTNIVLNRPLTFESIVPVNYSKINNNQIVRAFGNKFLVASKMYCRNTDTTGVTIDSTDEIIVHTLNDDSVITNSVSVSNTDVIDWTQPSTQSYMNYGSLSACVNSTNPDEYFIAFTTYNNKVIMYDSQVNGWENKTGGNITTSPDGLSPSDYMFTYPHTSLNLDSGVNVSRSNKPLSIKHFSNVHGLISGFVLNQYTPRIALSTDNLETFTTIFDDTNLLSLGITPSGSTADEKRQMNPDILTKIIDENTFYVQTGVFGDTGSYQFSINLFLKTVDKGVTWTDIMSSHLEYRSAATVNSFISENGNDIYVLAFYKNPTLVGVGDFNTSFTAVSTYPANQYSDVSDNGIIIFNYSNDGGNTWKYPSGSWKRIVPSGVTPQLSYYTIGSTAQHNGFLGGTTSIIFHDTNNDDIIVGLSLSNFNSGGRAFLVSGDNGETWNSYIPNNQTDITAYYDYNIRFPNSTVDFPISPTDYTDKHIITVGRIDSRPDKGDQNTIYNSYELGFLRNLGKDVDLTRVPRSEITITKNLKNISIDNFFGYYI